MAMERYKINLQVKTDEEAKIQDLSAELKEITEGKVEWIYRYCDRKEIGKAIYRDFLNYNIRQTSYIKTRDYDKIASEEDIEFIFSKDLAYEGILSQTQAFQTLASIINDFKVDDSDVRKQTDELLDRIIDNVNSAGGVYNFTTTPYLHNSKLFADGSHYYIDTITWVISSMLSYFRLYIDGKIDDDIERLNKAIAIYKVCVKNLLESYISKPESKNALKYGWNFTNGCDVPSLYFTFAVSEVMIDILTTFENVIRSADIELVSNEIDVRVGGKVSADELNAKKDQVRLAYQDNVKKLVDTNEAGRRERELFRAANDNFDVYAPASMYKRLEENVKEAANCIWSIVKDTVTDTFYSADLEKAISEDTIKQSSSNDALFNSIFIINTVINAGLDEDAEDEINYFTPTDSQDYDNAVSNYDTMRDYLRMAYDNTWQFYRRLKQDGKDYKVNEYNLSFDEKLLNKETAAMANVLRKERIRVFSLMPLLAKTKTTIGEFVIAYPQYDMQIYLEAILQHRYRSKSQNCDLWIWEKDGYSTSSNYYFVSALADFYNYYEKYEFNAIENANDNEKVKTDIVKKTKEEHLVELRQENGEIFNLEKTIESKNVEIERLEAELTALKAESREFREDPLKAGMSRYIRDIMREKMAEVLSADIVGTVLSDLSGQITRESVARVERKADGVVARDFGSNWHRREDRGEMAPDVEKLKDGISALGRAILSESIAELRYESAAKKAVNTEKNPEKLVSVSEREISTSSEDVSDDLREAVRLYLRPIILGAAGESDYVKTKGYESLPEVLDRYKDEKKKNKA